MPGVYCKFFADFLKTCRGLGVSAHSLRTSSTVSATGERVTRLPLRSLHVTTWYVAALLASAWSEGSTVLLSRQGTSQATRLGSVGLGRTCTDLDAHRGLDALARGVLRAPGIVFVWFDSKDIEGQKLERAPPLANGRRFVRAFAPR